MKRIAIVGAGGMARVRARAFLATGQAEICGIAARHVARAQALAAETGCPASACFDTVARLADTRPDAVLVEVPHEAQDRIVLWALTEGFPVLIGGSLATSVQAAETIRDLADRRGLLVEAGYEARYSPAWGYAKRVIDAGELGRLITVRTLALWAGDPRSWYYDQQTSGGMPVTHMTYCFINPVRWIVGEVRRVSAFASRVVHTDPQLVSEENCVANLQFDGGVLCSMTAGFVAPPRFPAWSATFIGSQGALEVCPDEGGSGAVTHYLAEGPERLDFRGEPDAFLTQAKAFLAALDGAVEACRNPPSQTLGDTATAEAIAASVREERTLCF